MIAHQDPSMYAPTVTPADFLQPIQERIAVLLLEEELLSPVSPGHHMIRCPGVLKSQLPRHGAKTDSQNQQSQPYNLNNLGLTPFMTPFTARVRTGTWVTVRPTTSVTLFEGMEGVEMTGKERF